jgi:hypothetical protein
MATAPPPTAPPIIAPVFEEPPPPPPEEEDIAAAGLGAVGTGVVVTVVAPGAGVLVVGEVVTVDPFCVVGFVAAATPGVQLKRPEESVLCTTQ